MKIDILTLFPDMFMPVLGRSITGRAIENGILNIGIHDIREYSSDRHRKVDDYPFGGGQGMVMFPQPIFDCIRDVGTEGRRMIYMSPRGRQLDRKLAEELACEESVLILCGHYEGVDQRVIDHFRMEEISIGDYILTGGELPAMVLVDTVARLIPGVLSGSASALDESVYSGLLEYPQYSQPRSYEGLDVPEVLTGGNHRLIDLWRYGESLKLTKERRPDLFEKYVRKIRHLEDEERRKGVKKPRILSKEEKQILESLLERD
ncbi:MAG: tRNA (guanosine(37)-N1)-methyltransferase TrmD [Clostridiales bacterium]|nr:tRNA (guanosine(37)-N1)-methyltransferase TrmD [Clostridiales bacterium]